MSYKLRNDSWTSSYHKYYWVIDNFCSTENAHLETMIDFCLDIQKVVEDFSQNMLWFR